MTRLHMTPFFSDELEFCTSSVSGPLRQVCFLDRLPFPSCAVYGLFNVDQLQELGESTAAVSIVTGTVAHYPI